jgi:hypothetical protein
MSAIPKLLFLTLIGLFRLRTKSLSARPVADRAPSLFLFFM